MWNRIWTLVIKEVLALLRDKRGRIVLIVPPIIQLFIFSFAATLDVRNVPIGIVNLDNGEKSYELIQRFKGSKFFTKIVHLESIDEATSFIDNMKGAMVLMFDEQFSRNLDAKKRADVMMILDGRRSNTTQIVAGYSLNIIDEFNRDYTANAHIYQQNSTIIARNWFNPNLIYYWYNIPSLCGILTMLVSLMITALSIARERELGTFEQLLVSPLLPIEILIGKTIPAIIIGTIEGSIIIFVGILLFQVPFEGNIFLLYLGMVVFICSIVGCGLFISSMCQTQQQAVLGTFVFMTPAVLLSGFATPVENMPQWLQPFAFLIPLKYFLIISKGSFLKGIDVWIVLQNLWPMVVISIFTLSGAYWFFNRKID